MTQSEKGYVVGLLKFKDLDNLGEFVENFAGKIADFFSEYDGKILVRTPDPHFLEGRRYDLHVIVEFAAFSTAEKMFNSADFEALQEHRRAAINVEQSTFLLLCGGDILAQ